MRPYLKQVAGRLLAGGLAGKVDASDVVQQALVAAAERFEQFRGTTAAQWQGWLVAIVRNETLNLQRFWHQECRDVGRDEVLLPSTMNQEAASGRCTPSEIAIRRERAVRLTAAIERLPAEYRQVIELRNSQGLAYSEIASRLGRSEDAVRQMWVRALQRLRRDLGDEE
ncbi:MAG: sigma-70 family RNA polymerase sigma factor [Planctomycetes bacterium]|nr:sigma-70 family RNA polymerase sigma factor [Planctomycetota bacterium]